MGREQFSKKNISRKNVEVIYSKYNFVIPTGTTFWIQPIMGDDFKSFSLSAWFGETPTGCTATTFDTTKGNGSLDLVSVGSSLTVGNSVYSQKVDRKIGLYIMGKIGNTDTIDHNCTGVEVYGWRN